MPRPHSKCISHALLVLVHQLDIPTHSSSLNWHSFLLTNSCQESGVAGGPVLYIGGLEDAFVSPADRLTAHDFSGCIATVVIDSIQLNMECPQNSRNVSRGCLFSPSCPTCTSECVKYGEFPGCQCVGGFIAHSCSSSSGMDAAMK